MNRKKEIQLIEYSYIFVGEIDEGKNKAVSKKVFEELESFVLQNNEIVQYLKLGQNKKHKFLQAQNYVGVIQTKSGFVIEILPKIAGVNNTKEENNKVKKILIKMLKSLKKSPYKNFNMANLKSTNLPLLEIFITMFLEEVSILIKKGIKSDYINKKENLKFLKGKLIISEQIKQNYIHKERFFVEYQDFMKNRNENKLIKTTLKYLYGKSKYNRNQQRIREFLFVFDEIDLSQNIKSDFKKVNLNRQMREYEKIMDWCKIFLNQKSFSLYKGKEVSFALLFDMNLLFESYVGNYLKNNGWDVTLQDRKYALAFLDGEREFLLKPDIVIKKGGKVIIADTKWKVLDKDKLHQGISQNDMYQLYAYGTKYENCNEIYLIYPKSEGVKNKTYTFFENGDLELKVIFFDILNGKFENNELSGDIN